jgi:hypothetical protein
VESFDQALKYLADHNPRDFIRFALGDPNVEVLKPLPAGLPARRRDVDGVYLISGNSASNEKPRVAHLEFHRRKQSLDELAIDVTEAQLRLYRRESKRVTSLVWDLYGKRDESFLETRKIAFGEEIQDQCSQGVYLRVNLRAIGWREFLRQAPPVLWPLIALTRDGVREEAIVESANAIKANKDLGFSEQTDYLAILRFVAEAEHVPRQLLETMLEEEFIMASNFYQSVINKGIVKGEAKTLATTIVDILERRLRAVKSDVRTQIFAETNIETLRRWKDMALDALDTLDAERAERVVEAIRNTRSV